MQDCEYVDAALPVRQGDVLKRVRGEGRITLAIVVTADCDIANEKFGDAGLACVHLGPLVDYVLGEHARNLAQAQIKKRFEKVAKWINQRWCLKVPGNVALSEERVQAWILASSPEDIVAELTLQVDDDKSFIKQESAALKAAQNFIDAPRDRYSAIDALCVLQSPQTTRSTQFKNVFGGLNPKKLPLDLFFVSCVPGEPGLGFVAKLQALTFIPFNSTFTSMDESKDFDNSFVRVGRLGPTFRHALAQQFGMLFARIGMPKAYEQDRDVAFEIIADQIKEEMEEQK